MRVSKRFNIGRYRLRGDANLYNVFNSDFVNSVNTTFSTTASNQFMRPTGVLQGRLFKVGGQIRVLAGLRPSSASARDSVTCEARTLIC